MVSIRVDDTPCVYVIASTRLCPSEVSNEGGSNPEIVPRWIPDQLSFGNNELVEDDR